MISWRCNWAMIGCLAVGFTSISPAAAQPPAPVVVDAVRQAGSIESAREMPGYVFARHRMTISSSLAGRLEWIREAGEAAQAGEELARIDTQPLLLQREEQEARLHRSQVELRHTQSRLDRAIKLDAQSFLSSNELEDLQERRALAEADIAIARAQLAQLDDRLSRSVIHASYAGVVTEQRRFAGEEVVAGEVLGAFVGTEELGVRAQLPLPWRNRLRSGGRIPVESLGRHAEMVVRAAIPAADQGMQTFELRGRLLSDETWAVGQLVTLRLPELAQSDLMLVPRDAVVLRREGARVVRITPDGHAEWVPVELGQGRGDWIVVTGALTIGDRVATRGAERLENDQPVEVVRDLAAEKAKVVTTG